MSPIKNSVTYDNELIVVLVEQEYNHNIVIMELFTDVLFDFYRHNSSWPK